MRRANLFLTILVGFLSPVLAYSQQSLVNQINKVGKLDNWCVREIDESGIIGGNKKFLYEFFGQPTDTIRSKSAFVKPEDYPWRTNNVLAIVAGVTKLNTTVFPEERGDGWCARIETHIETVKALGINMEVVCQGAFFLGDAHEPIKDTKNAQSKVEYGLPFEGRPTALVFDYKADVGHTVVKGTGFSKVKTLDEPDYPEIYIILQKRWEDEKGGIHALRVGSGFFRVTENAEDWVNGHRIEVKYGDISKDPDMIAHADLNNDPDRAFCSTNSKGKVVTVSEDGWADADEEPNYLIVNFLASEGNAFYGGVGNTLWIDNISIEM